MDTASPVGEIPSRPSLGHGFVPGDGPLLLTVRKGDHVAREPSRISDAAFIANVRLSREHGGAFVVCAECGMGMDDEAFDDYDSDCRASTARATSDEWRQTDWRQTDNAVRDVRPGATPGATPVAPEERKALLRAFSPTDRPPAKPPDVS
jgi:hypothetical protein